MNAKKLMRTLMKSAKKKSPAILTGLALVGIAVTAYQAYKAGLAATEVLKKHREEMDMVEPEDKAAKRTVVKETIKEMAPIVAPVIIMGVTTGACVVGAQSINSRRIAALSAAYTVAEKTVNDLNSKMREVLGVKKAQSIKDSIAKDKLHAKGSVPDGQVIITGDGNVRCMDEYTGRLFWGNARKIDKAVSELNNDVRCCRWVCLNDFYDKLGLQRIKMGYDLGWNEEDTLGNGSLPISFTAILDDDNNPVLCIECDVQLRKDYRELH